MAQGYYTLEEAARVLGMDAAKLSHMAQRREIRAFADRGTWRFRIQDVEDLSRRLASGDIPASPALSESLEPANPLSPVVADNPPAASPPVGGSAPDDDFFGFELSGGGGDDFFIQMDDAKPSPAPSKKEAALPPTALQGDDPPQEEFFAFELSDEGRSDPDMGIAPQSEPSSEMPRVREDATLGFAGEKSAPPPPSLLAKEAERSPQKKPASSADKPAAKTSLPGGGSGRAAKTSLPGGKSSQPAKTSLPARRGKTDLAGRAGGPKETQLTPESQQSRKPHPHAGGASSRPTPNADDMPFEMDFDGPALGSPNFGGDELPGPSQDNENLAFDLDFTGSSSDPASIFSTEEPDPLMDSDNLQIDLNFDSPAAGADEEFPAPAADNDDIHLDLGFDSQTPAAGGFGGDDGLLPVTEELRIDDLDAELRQVEEGMDDFGLGISAKTRMPSDSSEPFELSEADLGDDEVALGDLIPTDDNFTGAGGASALNLLPADSGINLEVEGSTSENQSDEVEFELNLDANASLIPSSTGVGMGSGEGSEFELTLDESGDLVSSVEDDGTATPHMEEKDIFETDFEIPALDQESASEAVALGDADAEEGSSDFDFEVSDEESGSQVVAIGDEEEEGEGESEVDEEGDSDDDAAPHGRRAAALVGAAPGPWGVFPVAVLVPSTFVMFLLGLMTFEILQGMGGYNHSSRPTGMVLRMFAGLFGVDVPND